MDAETKGMEPLGDDAELVQLLIRKSNDRRETSPATCAMAAATITRLTAERDEARARAERAEDLLLNSTERMEATLAAMDKYNEANGTYIIGPSLLGLGTQIAANRAALTQEAAHGQS